MGCSLLNGHISLLMHLTDDPSCPCGAAVESPRHYFMDCPLHARPRNELINTVNSYTDCNINVLLFGIKNLTLNQNTKICESVHKFMIDTRRFEGRLPPP